MNVQMQSLPCQGESIYNLIPQQQPKMAKASRYRSTFTNVVKQESSKNKQSSKTMGPAKVVIHEPGPESFLKSHSREPKLPEKKPFKYEDEERRRPPVPTHKERPQVMGLRSNKDHIKCNAVETIMSVPKKPEKKYVDTRGGATHQLEASGLTPKFVAKKDYGKSPQYLERRKAETQRAQQEYDAYVQERMRQGAMKQMSAQERQAVIDGLKQNWEELHHQYQGLSVVTDTAPKKARKERMEAEMKQLERDIEMMSSYKCIFLANY